MSDQHKKFTEDYKYYEDTRTEEQKEKNSLKIRQLTLENTERVNKNISSAAGTARKFKKEDFLYVCLNGIPPAQNEFSSLNLPGQSFQYIMSLMQAGISPEQEAQSWQQQTVLLKKQIEKHSKTKPIVFVYHSFGTFLLVQYFKYQSSERVIGLVDIGGVPIRFYHYIKVAVAVYSQIDFEFIEKNIESLTQTSNASFGQMNNAFKMSTRQQLGFIKVVKKDSFGFKTMFQDHRDYLPQVLKCFIFGRQDNFFHEALLTEKASFFCYNKALSPIYRKRVQRAFGVVFGESVENVQEKFVFDIEKGKHSIHLQKKFKDLLSKIVATYLSVIEQALVQSLGNL